jgi:hypothetical protein
LKHNEDSGTRGGVLFLELIKKGGKGEELLSVRD